jgi:hypothetical protein
MKKILCFLFALSCYNSYAQDFIYRINGDKISAKVLEIDKAYISYKKFDNQDGPTYKMVRKEIVRIEYKNGTVENFVEEKPLLIGYSTGFGRNLVNFDFVSLLFSEVGISYEHIFGSGIVGLKIPVICGFNHSNYNSWMVYNNFISGIDLNLYPTGQGRVRYFVGPGFRVGSVSVTTYSPFSYDSNGYYVEPVPKTINSGMTAFQVNNGVLFQPTINFNISLVLGIGLRKIYGYNQYDSFGPNYGTFNANVAYRF